MVGYSKAPEQPQSSARPICHSHAMTNTGANQTPYALLHRSLLRYALRHGRRQGTNNSQSSNDQIYITIINMLKVKVQMIKYITIIHMLMIVIYLII